MHEDDHPSFLQPSSRDYLATYNAEPGYKIAKHNLRISSKNHFSLEKIELSESGAELNIKYKLTSGPMVDRWRGWIKSTIETVQLKIE